MANKAFTTRIITGKLKGKPLALPTDENVRPTRERVRQAVFNMLNSRMDLDGVTVVDLCCGSGAWGLEAYSRGASKVWLVDKDVKSVRANVAALGLAGDSNVVVVEAEVMGWVPPEVVDVVLADPPYGRGMAKGLLARAKMLGAEGSWWAVEHGTGEVLDWEGFEDVDGRTYGVTSVTLGRLL